MGKLSSIKQIPEPRREFFENDAAYRYFLDLTRVIKELQVGAADDLASHQHTVSDVTDLTLGKTIGDVPQYEDDGSSNPVLDHPNHPLVNGVSVLVAPGTSTDPALAFDTWRTPNANRPTLVFMHIRVETDGTSTGRVIVDVDEGGGTTADYSLILDVSSELTNGTVINYPVFLTIPAGGSYQVRNSIDPNTSNAISVHREFTP